MKELTIEEKAQKYDEVFGRAQELYNNPYSSNVGKGYVYTIFPELKESEDKDEKIRKSLINYFKRRDSYRDEDETWEDFISFKDIIAWLEKQKDMKAKLIISDEGYSKAFQDGIEEALTNPHKYGLEKQGKQKPAWSEGDEHKFKIATSVLVEGYEATPELIRWLKSLKHRIQP